MRVCSVTLLKSPLVQGGTILFNRIGRRRYDRDGSCESRTSPLS